MKRRLSLLVGLVCSMPSAAASAATHHRSAKVARPAGNERSCAGAGLTPGAHNLRRVTAATLCLINGERARHGERPLIQDARLASAAAGHSRDMDARDYFSHVSPDGQTPLQRIRASGFIARHGGWMIGENIAWGSMWLASPRAIVRAWMASPDHRANILERAYRFTGVGIEPALPRSMAGGQSGAMYTQDFGALTSG